MSISLQSAWLRVSGCGQSSHRAYGLQQRSIGRSTPRVIGQQSQQIAAAHPGVFRQLVPGFIFTDLVFALAFTYLFVKVGATLGGGRMAGVKLGLLVAVLSPVIERSRDGLPRRGEVRFPDRLPTAFRRIAQGHYPRCYRRPPSR